MDNSMNRDSFMSFFRDEEKLNLLSTEDRIEIFCQILTGSDDFSKKLFTQLLSDYCIDFLEVIDNRYE